MARLIACLVMAGSAMVRAADDPVARLRGARSLHCIFTSGTSTADRNGQRIVEQHGAKGEVLFDNIDLVAGTARIVTREIGARPGGVRARWNRSGSLWLVEQSLSGVLNSTTIFPVYAQGTHDFMAVVSRHSTMGTTATGVSGLDETDHGTCTAVPSAK